jgi:hypothetical protein
MRHFLFLILFALSVAVVFGVLANGSTKARVFAGAKVFLEFVGIGLILAWIFYFLPMR